MPIKVSCPQCAKELNAPDDLVGQLVACPRCSNKFHVKIQAGTAKPAAAPAAQVVQPKTPSAHPVASRPQSFQDNMLPPTAKPSSSAAANSRAAELPPPPTSGGAPSSTANLERISLGKEPTGPSRSRSSEPRAAQPAMREPSSPAPQQPAISSTPAAPNDAAFAGGPSTASGSAAAGSAPPVGGLTPSATPEGSGKTAQIEAASATADGPPPQPAAPARRKREVKQAKFVASGAVSTRINLGEDGQLPELVVADSKTSDESDDQPQASSSPMFMLGVLIFSVVASVVMLTLPDSTARQESTSKQDAIAHIEKHYIGLREDPQPNQELKPYQKLLRQGLQAQRRGDQDAARLAYRRVLAMLRAESTGNRGVTTEYKWAEFPPNDRDLESHLNVLLADD